MSDPSELRTVIAAACDGDPQAFAALVERFTGLVRASVLRVTTQQEDVSDAVQQTWLILMLRIGTVREPEALPGWLATTARREALRILRERRRALAQLNPQDLENVEDPGDGPEAIAIRHDLAARVQRALDRMPARRALLLMDVVGNRRPYQDVSRDLDCPIGSLGPLRARYLHQLGGELRACGVSAA